MAKGGGGQHEGTSMQRAAVDAVAGVVAGGVSRSIVSPLDVIKIRFQSVGRDGSLSLSYMMSLTVQYIVSSIAKVTAPRDFVTMVVQVQLEPTSKHTWASGGVASSVSKYTSMTQATRDILREEGLLGFWRGNVPALLLVMPYTAIQFVVIQKFKIFITGSTQSVDHIQMSPAMSFIGGAVAGTAATIGSYPFDLLRTILASQGEPKVYPNLRYAALEIFRTKGVVGLYAGLTPSLVEIVPYAGLQFGSYDSFKRWTLAWNEQSRALMDSGGDASLSGTQKFTCGLGAGLVAKLCCHPLDVVKKRYQVEGLARDPRYGARVQEKQYRNMWDAIKKIVETEGWRGLYKGTLPSIVKAAPNAAVTFFVFESCSEWLRSFI